MKIKAACIGTPERVSHRLSGTKFASWVLSSIAGDKLGATNVLDRPAEYYVQDADVGPANREGVMGVEVRLTGASRNGRTTKQLYSALDTLLNIVVQNVQAVLEEGERCQVFCVLMLDGEIEYPADSGHYTSVLESEAVWVMPPPSFNSQIEAMSRIGDVTKASPPF